MENTAKKSVAKTQTVANKSMNKIAKTAKNINTQVTDTVEDVMTDVKTSGKEISALATKTVKEATKTVKEAAKKVDAQKSINKIKATAGKVNAQIQATATEVFEDVKASGKEMQANTVKMAKEAIENVNITDRMDTVKKAVKNANAFTLETAEELVDGMFANGEKWQNVAAKAVKSGLKIAEKQQDLMFSTLEAVKGQFGTSANRLRSIFKSN